MCTAIAFHGNDLLYGFNLDIDPAVWNYSLYKTKNIFAIGITVGKTMYCVHGVNRDAHFGVLPYMNGDFFPVSRGVKRERIDLLNDRYVRGRYSFQNIEEILSTKTLVSIPNISMHSMIGNESGQILIVEPGYGVIKVEDHFAALTNFPILASSLVATNPFYGKDRYDKAISALSIAGNNFTPADALQILWETKQEGQWATRVSFVYSKNHNTVYYFLNGNHSHVEEHHFY